MKFSVLIPVYNAEKYLQESLSSVLEQTYQNFEIVLVDDGSTDNSGKICDRYQAEYPSVVKVIHQKNQGQLASRCNAIKAATGDYCVFMDADDLIVKDAFEILNKNLTKSNFPDMLIYSFYYEKQDGSKRKAEKLFDDNSFFDSSNKEELYKMFFTGTGLNNVWTKAVKRSVLTSIDYDFTKFMNLRCSEDKLYSMAVVNDCKTIVLKDTPLYIYRLFEGSVTRKFTVESIEKFKVPVLYQAEKDFRYKWKLPLPEWKNRMDAQWIQTTFYVFDLFYNNVLPKDCAKVLQYNWCSFLDKETLANINDNPFLNDTYKKIWSWIINKKYVSLKFYFWKKKLRKQIKSLKK